MNIRAFNILQVYQYFTIYRWFFSLNLNIFHEYLMQQSLKLGGTNYHFKWVKVPGTTPYWKAWYMYISWKKIVIFTCFIWLHWIIKLEIHLQFVCQLICQVWDLQGKTVNIKLFLWIIYYKQIHNISYLKNKIFYTVYSVRNIYIGFKYACLFCGA